jgi:hypothetical protein
MKSKKKPSWAKAARRRAGAMLKPFHSQVFESRRAKERRKTRLRKDRDPREGW